MREMVDLVENSGGFVLGPDRCDTVAMMENDENENDNDGRFRFRFRFAKFRFK